MDLTTSYPRSVKDKIGGLVQIGRTIDKGKAVAHGKAGEYHYNCPMDQHVFEFLGIDHEQLLDVIKTKSDGEVEAYVTGFIKKKSPAEIEAFNTEWLTHAPAPGTDSYKYFMELRNEVAPDRTDVTAWADLLDLDEKRPVPHRVAA